MPRSWDGTMTDVRLIWPPWPYRAGFCITDDTDGAQPESVRIVYDLLRSLNLKTTKTVWAFEPEEPSGIPPTSDSNLRGVTLADSDYLDYCKLLASEGFEIALHGASAGNNRRERTIAAFELMDREFAAGESGRGGYRGTFVCHARNADNLYWQEKVVSSPPLRRLLRIYSRHKTFGEVEGTPYFWGDICSDRVGQVRLFRTRHPNTLSVNPSMPYFDRAKPFVGGWFSATKRSFHDCTTDNALDRIAAEYGLTVLSQYMHRYANLSGGNPIPEFRNDAERLAADSRILVDSVGAIMARLKAMQSVFLGYRQNELMLFNAGSEEVRDLQVLLEGTATMTDADHTAEGPVSEERRGLVRVPLLRPGERIGVRCNESLQGTGRTALRLDPMGRGEADFGHGRFYSNIGSEDWYKEGTRIPAGSFATIFEPGLSRLRPFSQAGSGEVARMLAHQAGIIVREVLQGERQIGTEPIPGTNDLPAEAMGGW